MFACNLFCGILVCSAVLVFIDNIICCINLVISFGIDWYSTLRLVTLMSTLLLLDPKLVCYSMCSSIIVPVLFSMIFFVWNLVLLWAHSYKLMRIQTVKLWCELLWFCCPEFITASATLLSSDLITLCAWTYCLSGCQYAGTRML